MAGVAIAPGVAHYPGWFDRAGQETLVATLREAAAAAPFFTPVMPRTGKPFSVRMTNCGPLGWVSDLKGYRYQPTHPATGGPWAPMPQTLLDLWNEVSGYPHPPKPASSISTTPRRRWACTRTATSRTSMLPSSPCRSATAPSSASGRDARRADARRDAAKRRRADLRRPGQARLPRRHEGPARKLDAAAAGRAHQPDAAPRHAPGLSFTSAQPRARKAARRYRSGKPGGVSVTP